MRVVGRAGRHRVAIAPIYLGGSRTHFVETPRERQSITGFEPLRYHGDPDSDGIASFPAAVTERAVARGYELRQVSVRGDGGAFTRAGTACERGAKSNSESLNILRLR